MIDEAGNIPGPDDIKVKERARHIQSPEVKFTGDTVVQTAIRRCKEYSSSIFVGVDEIVVEPTSGEELGYVTTKDNRPEVIHLDLAKNVRDTEKRLDAYLKQRPENTSNLPKELRAEAASIVVANTIVHEIGHIKDELKGGEAPAKAEELKFKPYFEREWNKLLKKISDEIDKKDKASIKVEQQMEYAGLIKNCDLFFTLVRRSV